MSSSVVLHLLVPGRSLYLELTCLVKLLLSELRGPAGPTSSTRAAVSELRASAGPTSSTRATGVAVSILQGCWLPHYSPHDYTMGTLSTTESLPASVPHF